MSLQVLKTEPTGVVFADPVEPDLNVRFKHTSRAKSLSGVPTTNHVTEIIVNDDNTVTIGGSDVVDALSVRVRVSGCPESVDRLEDLLGLVADGLLQWHAEHVFVGFPPATAPAIPVP
jgi:hypothetical protein